MNNKTVKIFVFGNPDHPQDNKAILVAKSLQEQLPNYTFTYMSSPDQLDHLNQLTSNTPLIIIDTATGIKDITMLSDLDKLTNQPKTTVHDFDIGFQLKLLKKLGKVKNVQIIAIPLTMQIENVTKKVETILQSMQSQGN